jgi:ribonuclease HII
MLIYAGIDEAGYGPMLGPLCVACTAFSVREHDLDKGAPNLWTLLKAAVTRKKSDRKNRIAVEDSKTLLVQGADQCERVRHLERGVLAFASRLRETPVTCGEYLQFIGAAAPTQRWYESVSPMPVGCAREELRIASAMLHRALDKAGVNIELMRCEAIDVDAFNAQVDVTHSKATVNFAAAMRLAATVWRKWPGDNPRIVIDRQGGRTHYRQDLQFCFPDATLSILEESDRTSRYQLAQADSTMTISFVTGSESLHFPAALASMTAKLTRELMMIRMNRFFTGLMPELKPTAGYVQDARRYLQDIEPVIRREAIDVRHLVRSR